MSTTLATPLEESLAPPIPLADVVGLSPADIANGSQLVIAAYKELSERKDGDMPADAILMQLGRTYIAAGKKDDAKKTFTKVVDEHPDSPYAAEARQELDALKG